MSNFDKVYECKQNKAHYCNQYVLVLKYVMCIIRVHKWQVSYIHTYIQDSYVVGSLDSTNGVSLDDSN